MRDIAIKVENLGKLYRIGEHVRYKTLTETLTHAISFPYRWIRNGVNGTHEKAGSENKENQIWALKDVSFEVKQGEVVGIIGRNGAGKSTLLKILSRITEPTEGYAELHGRVGSLLEVGTGFHPELTGRENIFLSAAIMGMKRDEIKRKFDEIVDFAEIEKFIDTPVKRYSSGMHVRLAFAVAAHLEPEILLVDEVLAVGDAAFQKKCLGKMDDVAKHGRTVLFVSHNMGAVNALCPRAVLLEGGKLVEYSNTSIVTANYLTKTFASNGSKHFVPKLNMKGQIIRVRLLDEKGAEITNFSSDKEPLLEIKYILNHKVKGCHLACILSSSDGFHIFSSADTDLNQELFSERLPGEYQSRFCLPTKMLNTGSYNISIGLGVPGIENFDRQEAISFTIHDVGDFGSLKEGSRRGGLLLVQIPWEHELLKSYG